MIIKNIFGINDAIHKDIFCKAKYEDLCEKENLQETETYKRGFE
jgi:hypothetical protein